MLQKTCLGPLVFAIALATANPATAQSCKPVIEQEAPIIVDGNRILVAGTVNGFNVAMEINTGGEMSVVNRTTAAAMNLQPDITRRIGLKTPDGTVPVRGVLLRNVTVAGKSWPNYSMPLIRVTPREDDSPVGMALGADWVADRDLELDLDNGRLTLWNVTGCAGDFVPWQQPHSVLPLQSDNYRRRYVTVEIGGRPLKALIATGATVLMMPEPAARRLGVTSTVLANDPMSDIPGIDPAKKAFRRHVFADVRIGAESAAQIAIHVGDFHMHVGDMILGMPYFAHRHFWISYTTNQLFMLTRKNGSNS
jgi:predicted aspartyl protease